MTEQPASGRSPFWLRPGFWRWSVRLLVAGILLILAGAVWILVYPPALEPVREDLEGWLSDRLGRPVQFQQVSWTWDNGFTARGVDVHLGDPGVAVAEARLGLGVWALLRGELDLRSLSLKGLEVKLERDSRGRLFAGGFRVDPKRNRLFPLLARFDRVDIGEASLVWSDRSRSDPVRLALTDASVAIERISRGHLVDLTARAGGGRISVHGSVEDFEAGPENWTLNTEARAEGVSPAPFLPYLPQEAPEAVPGPLSLWAEVNGGWQNPTRIRGNMRFQEGQIRWPERLRQPLPEAGARTDFRYQWEAGSHRLELDQMRLAAAGVAVTGGGELRWQAGFEDPHLDAELGLGRTPLPALRRLLALRALPGPLVEWLQRSVLGGRIERGQARIRGPLRRFPFADGGGTFRMEAKVAGGELAYHPDWPSVTALSGTLTVDRRRLTLSVASGRVSRGRIRGATASVHDLADDPARLRIQGQVGLQLADGVRFLEQSPLQPEGFLEPAVLAGPADLDLALEIALTEDVEPNVSGRLGLDGAALRPRPGTPALVNMAGEVAFQGGRIRASGLNGRLLGQSVTVDLDREPDKPLRAEVTGTFPAEALRTALARHGPDHPLSRRLTGEVGARLQAVWGREERHAELHGDLERAALILPEPLFNGIGDPGEVTVRMDLAPNRRVEASLATGGNRWDMLAAPDPEGDWQVGLGIGLQAEAPPRKLGACLVAGRVDRLPLKDWVALWRDLGHDGGGGVGAELPQLQADVRVGSFEWGQRGLGGGRLKLSATPAEAGHSVRANFQGDRASGRVSLQPHGGGPDQLEIRMENLELPEPGKWAADDDGPTIGELAAGLDLELTMAAASLHIGESQLTDAFLRGRLQPEQWRLQHLQSRMGESTLEASGGWTAERGRTQLELSLETEDFGGWLRSLGLYPSMKGGHGSISGDLGWPGRPTAFSPGKLGGDLRLSMAEGEIEQFYFLNQALATLNVLDWPRQVARGFRDVARGGLVYRELKGGLHIVDGVARTDDWVLKSAPLRLGAAGSLDLAARNYDLIMQIQPLQTVDQIISAVPIVGYLIGGESKTVMALDYRVRGPWSDPDVTALSAEEQENPMDTLLRRLREMEWKDVLPWR